MIQLFFGNHYMNICQINQSSVVIVRPNNGQLTSITVRALFVCYQPLVKEVVILLKKIQYQLVNYMVTLLMITILMVWMLISKKVICFKIMVVLNGLSAIPELLLQFYHGHVIPSLMLHKDHTFHQVLTRMVLIWPSREKLVIWFSSTTFNSTIKCHVPMEVIHYCLSLLTLIVQTLQLKKLWIREFLLTRLLLVSQLQKLITTQMQTLDT